MRKVARQNPHNRDFPNQSMLATPPTTSHGHHRGQHRSQLARRLFALVVTLALLQAWPSPAVAAGLPQPRPNDEVWLVSDRGLGCANASDPARMQYWHFDSEKAWVRSTLDEFLASDDPQAITTFFVHGNRISWCEAFTKGWRAYRTLVGCADDRPIRFVIWSWPSEAIHGPVKDARIKASRTDPCGQHLAALLERMDPEVPVSLWGHSYGARVITGALHLLGGGTLQGQKLASRDKLASRRMQAVLLASALDSDWLIPGHAHGQAMSQVGRLLLVNNCCDALLKRYHLLYGRRCTQEALGYTGLAVSWLSPGDRHRVDQINACGYVGKKHWFDLYASSPDLVARMRECLLTDHGPASAEEVAAPHETTAELAPLEMAAGELAQGEIETGEIDIAGDAVEVDSIGALAENESAATESDETSRETRIVANEDPAATD